MNTFDELAKTLATLRAQHGSSLPQPIRISDKLCERLKAASLFSHRPIANREMRLLTPEQVFGLQIIVDESIPEGRVGYQDSEGNLHLI